MNDKSKSKAITSSIVQSIENSLIGKSVEVLTNFSVSDVLKNCVLSEPEEIIPGFYGLMTWDSGKLFIQQENIYDIQMLLKQAWVLNPKNQTEKHLYGAIVQEIAKYDSQLLYEANQNTLRYAENKFLRCKNRLKDKQKSLNDHQKKLKARVTELDKCHKELSQQKEKLTVTEKQVQINERAFNISQKKLKVERKSAQTINTQLKICKSDFNACQKNLLAAKDESKTYRLKIEETRLKRVKAAKKERSWKALDDWLLQHLRMKKRTCKELWAALPEKGDNYQFYRKDEEICCRSKTRKSIKFRAFCDHVKKVKKKIIYG